MSIDRDVLIVIIGMALVIRGAMSSATSFRCLARKMYDRQKLITAARIAASHQTIDSARSNRNSPTNIPRRSAV